MLTTLYPNSKACIDGTCMNVHVCVYMYVCTCILVNILVCVCVCVLCADALSFVTPTLAVIQTKRDFLGCFFYLFDYFVIIFIKYLSISRNLIFSFP